MDTEVEAGSAGSSRRLLATVAIALVVGMVLGALATAAVLRRGTGPAGPSTGPRATTELACTAIGASDGIRVEFTREQAADATSFTLVARDHLQSTVLEQRIDESSWVEDKAIAWLTTSPDTMSALTGVELTFHGPSGDRTLAAAELGTPTEVSPNGEHCEPHVLQSAFTVEREALVRSDA